MDASLSVKASELITQLQALVKTYGDLPVCSYLTWSNDIRYLDTDAELVVSLSGLADCYLLDIL